MAAAHNAIVFVEGVAAFFLWGVALRRSFNVSKE